ncbi:unnamed protein product, partial [Rotaria magnacalcarata]
MFEFVIFFKVRMTSTKNEIKNTMMDAWEVNEGVVNWNSETLIP